MARGSYIYGKVYQLQDGHFLCLRLKRSQSQTTHLRISPDPYQYCAHNLCRDEVFKVFEWDAYGKRRNLQAFQCICSHRKHLPY
jgi:hypothetical protein